MTSNQKRFFNANIERANATTLKHDLFIENIARAA